MGPGVSYEVVSFFLSICCLHTHTHAHKLYVMESIKIQKTNLFLCAMSSGIFRYIGRKELYPHLKMLYKEQRTLKYPSTLIER